jgi:DNA-binding NarL/FixJ family response regulator
MGGYHRRRTCPLPSLQRAVSRLESVPYPFDAARARLWLAQALADAGQRDEAIREARAALQLLEGMGARPATEQARALLREFGARVPGKRSGPGFDGLTARELDIVRFVALRESNKEIGARLHISARTVGTHLANIFDKVGVRDRTALGDLARERGLHQR